MMTSLRQLSRLVISLYFISVSAAQVSDPGDDDLTLDEVIVKSYASSGAADFIQSNNTLLVELDVILSPEQWARRNNNRDKRSGIIGDEWPNAEIPFQEFNRSIFNEKEIEIIRGAFAEYSRYTCVRFRLKKDHENGHIFFYDAGRCSSAVGYGGYSQPVSLAETCRTHGVVVHELGHAVGLHHEQTRPDRDLYVRIVEDNIGKISLFNFKKEEQSKVDSRGIPYDYLSIMHYGSGAFAKDPSKPGIIVLDSRFKNRIGQSRGLSFEDIHLINLKYRCSASCPNTRCPEGAFLSKDCTCWCKRNVEFGEPVALCDSGDRVPGGKPGEGFGTCGNEKMDSDCEWMKSVGFCEDSFASFMMTHCRETCGWCGDTDGTDTSAGTGTGTDSETGGGVCEDENPSCSVWAEHNFCNIAEHQGYMSRACKKSCKLCGGAAAITASCRDISPSCSGFKSRGDCETNPHWMSIYCKATCNACRSGFGGARKGKCKDTNADCEPWVERGMCKDNKEYMSMNCAKACGFCK